MADLFTACCPKEDILSGNIADGEYAADLGCVIRNEGDSAYTDAARFFADTYPTQDIQKLCGYVCQRLRGDSALSAIFHLDTTFGGGKTHALIALAHLARAEAQSIPNIDEFIDPALLPATSARVAAFVGDNADPANGVSRAGGILTKTPWGDIAYMLAGADGYARVAESDKNIVAPGADTLRELIGEAPTLILLDELAIYWRKLRQLKSGDDQLTPFLTALINAVESSPKAALVFTLAVDRQDGTTPDAYAEENAFLQRMINELQSVAARKATIINPTNEKETVQVLKRRLFAEIDAAQAQETANAYAACWRQSGASLPEEATRPEAVEAMRESYPFHPALIDMLKTKTATLPEFQRTRGMLRLLGKTVARLWQTRPRDAAAIHCHHIDLNDQSIQDEIVVRLQQQIYRPAIIGDIVGTETPALAQRLDKKFYPETPFASYVARTVFMHTMAFNQNLQGVPRDGLYYSMLSPGVTLDFISDARERFEQESAYLDDRSGAPMRFLAEANLNRIIQTEQQNIPLPDADTAIKDEVKKIFQGGSLETVIFPADSHEIPDNQDGKPVLSVMSYDGETVSAADTSVPSVITDRLYMWADKSGKRPRVNRNWVLFLIADRDNTDRVRQQARRLLALERLVTPSRIEQLADHQQKEVKRKYQNAKSDLAIAIQNSYRHLYYPDNSGLQHATIETQATAAQPGSGERAVIGCLADANKLSQDGAPPSPGYLRDKTPLGREGVLRGDDLRSEFRQNLALPIVLSDDVIIKCIDKGVKEGSFIYQYDDLLYGPGDSPAAIKLDGTACIHTLEHAKQHGIWPRPQIDPQPEPGPKPPIPPPPRPRPLEPVGGEYVEEGMLKEALNRILRRLQEDKVERIVTLVIHIFDMEDAAKFPSVFRGAPRADLRLQWNGSIKVGDGHLTFEYDGANTDVEPFAEFLAGQQAQESDIQAEFTANFQGSGLDVAVDGENLCKQLTRYSVGMVHVRVVALSAAKAA